MSSFSVLIANYNNAAFISSALDSVFNQSYTDWEIVIIDDYSTDNSLEILSTYRNNPKIRIFKNERNRGVGYTKNKCIQLAKGELVGFLDPDDRLTPNALQVMTDAFSRNPDCSIIYSTHYICDDKLNIIRIADYIGKLTHDDFLLFQPDEKAISHFAVFKKKNYLQTEGIALEMEKAVDHDLYYLLEETGPVFFVNQPLYYYRRHPGNISLGRLNVYTAMFWDFVAKSRAFKRRMNNAHKLFLRNEKNYTIQYLYSTLISFFFLKKGSLAIDARNIIRFCIKNKVISISFILKTIAKTFILTCIKYPVIKLVDRK